MLRIAWIFAAFAVLAAMSTTARATGDPRLVGWWYGEGPQASGQYSQWMMHYGADETFRIEFRLFSGCRSARTQVESGVWQLKGRQLILITARIDGSSDGVPTGGFRDSYSVERLDRHREELIHERGLRFSSRRVAETFAFPPPANAACPTV